MIKTSLVRVFHEITMKEAVGIKRLKNNYYPEVPQWLIAMLNTNYFQTCIAHEHDKRNELDHFCIDCMQSFCSNCRPVHAVHKNVKIRRYVYCEVINREDLCKIFDCVGIQAYHTNKRKVLFLKQRTQQQPHQPHNSRDGSCIICNRSLPDSMLYCSIACKVSAIQEGDHKEQIDHHGPFIKETYKRSKSSKAIDREDQTVSAYKRQKLRKGVALRAPFF